MAKILIVEPSDIQMQALEILLTQQGYEVIKTKNRRDGLQCAKEHAGDLALVICEMNLPRSYDGPLLIRSIREDDGLARVKVLVFTTETSEAMRFAAQTAGATHMHSKPLIEDEFLSILARLLC